MSVTGHAAADTPVVTSIGATASLLSSADGSPAGTTITLVHSGDLLAAGSQISVTYLGLQDLVTVRGANNVNIPLRLRETGPDTGVFEGHMLAVNGIIHTSDIPNNHLDPTRAGDADIAQIAVIDGGLISVTYGDRDPVISVRVLVQVEAEPPSFSNASPPDGALTSNLDTVLSVDVFDTIAGVNSTSDLSFFGTPKSIGLTLTVDTVPTAVRTADIGVAETAAGSGVYRIQYNINNIKKIKDAITAQADITSTITWVFAAKDKAGNGTGSGVRTLTVDNTSVVLSHAVTGNHWNTVTERLEGSRASLPGTDKRTSIQVVFSKPMDGASLQAGDFTVDGVNPVAVSHVSGLPNSVFLTVPEMGPSATPVVTIVGEVRDSAGNPLTTGTITAQDGIAPKLTVTFADILTTGDVELNVNSDEAIAGALPITKVFACKDPLGSTTSCTGDVAITPSTVVVTQQKAWTSSLKSFAVGRYTVQIEVRDASGNLSRAGGTDNSAPGALSFEIDTSIPAPVAILPTDGSTVGFANPFSIEIDWWSEGTEYTGDSHAKVQLTKAELNGQNLLADAVNRDQRVWLIPIPNIALGQQTLVFSGVDEGGNASQDMTLSFTVEAPLVQGTVDLQGRENEGGASISFLDGSVIKGHVTTIADGSYALSPPPGVYTVTVSKEGFLTATRANVQVEADKVLLLPLVRLLAGDVDGNGVIELKDVTISAVNLGKDSSPWP